MPVPDHPKIYHITHIDNLESIFEAGCLRSDSVMSKCPSVLGIGIKEIKQNRLTLPVSCYPETSVGDYVPFYFCPRSVMLYVIYRGNHTELTYRGGQTPVIHLESSLSKVIRWAEGNNRKWVFSLSNAASPIAEFRNKWNQLDEINWYAVTKRDR